MSSPVTAQARHRPHARWAREAGGEARGARGAARARGEGLLGAEGGAREGDRRAACRAPAAGRRPTANPNPNPNQVIRLGAPRRNPNPKPKPNPNPNQVAARRLTLTPTANPKL
eukprot:scaffold7443_cov54-Phaeocystis_antarctica.AAC.3